MQGIESTEKNLQTAINGEMHEFSEMYPAFIKDANAEGQTKAADSFDLANKVEKTHHKLYTDALAGVKGGGKAEVRPFYVCQVCGNTVEGEAPDKCPVCNAPKKSFKLVE
jgi:rubrerythrin